MYESAREAANDMTKRGYTVDAPAEDTDTMGGGRMRGAAQWQRVRGKEPRREMAQWTREKLQDYQMKM